MPKLFPSGGVSKKFGWFHAYVRLYLYDVAVLAIPNCDYRGTQTPAVRFVPAIFWSLILYLVPHNEK